MSDKSKAAHDDPFRDLRKHLSSGTLTEEERKMLEELFNQIHSAQNLGSVAGRPIIARLPGGLDVIK